MTAAPAAPSPPRAPGGRRLFRPRLGSVSLVRRLVGLAAVWSLMVLVAAGFGLTALFRQASINRFDQSLAELADQLLAGASVGEGGEVFAPALTDARALRVYSGRYWQIGERTGERVRPLVRSRSLWDTGELHLTAAAAARMGGSATPVFYDTAGPLGETLRAAAIQSRLPGRAQPLVFIVAEDRGPLDADARRFFLITAGALVALGAGLVVAVLVQVRVGLNPVFLLRREVAAVRRGKADRLSRRYPTELQPLADELNGLITHNQEVVERQRTHVGNLAHALKTPISVMLSEAESGDDALAEVVRRQAAAMREHVDHHLRRARAAARAQTAGERTSVPEVLEELALTLERIFQDKGAEIDWRAPDDLCFLGERQDLLEMAGNALENACKYGGGRVRATASPLTDERLRLVVEDDGAGLPPDRYEEVLKRGARLDESAPGSGLGLSIVDELARAYGGSLALGRSERMGGLQVTLELPRALS